MNYKHKATRTLLSPPEDLYNGTGFTAPVIIEAIRSFNGQSLVRCLYFAVESNDLLQGWHLTMKAKQQPVLLNNFLAILITGPLLDDRFHTVKNIEDLFGDIEKNSGLLINTNDIWFPQRYFRSYCNPGALHRVSMPLFLYALKKRAKESAWTPQDNLNVKKQDNAEMIEYSHEETTAFNLWTTMQIDNIRDISRMRPERKLKNRMRKGRK